MQGWGGGGGAMATTFLERNRKSPRLSKLPSQTLKKRTQIAHLINMLTYTRAHLIVPLSDAYHTSERHALSRRSRMVSHGCNSVNETPIK